MNKRNRADMQSDEERLIDIGNIVLLKENKKGNSNCWKCEDKYDYQEIENAVSYKAKSIFAESCRRARGKTTE